MTLFATAIAGSVAGCGMAGLLILYDEVTLGLKTVIRRFRQHSR